MGVATVADELRVNSDPARPAGGVLRIEVINEIVPDPVLDYGNYSRTLHAEIYNGLIAIVDDVNAPFQPDLAERYTVSDGGMRYDFTLRKGLKFSDGSPLTANDIVWSWSRALKPSTGSNGAWEVLGAIDGAKEVAAGTASELRGAVAVDDRTIRVFLSHHDSGFLAGLADPVTAVLSRANVERWDIDFSVLATEDWMPFVMDDLPVGTGPFRLVKYSFTNGITALERNDHYHGKDAHLDRIEFVPSTPGDQFSLGEVDMTWSFPNRITAMKGGSSIRSVPVSPRTTFIALNPAVVPLNDLSFRRALAASAEPHRAELWYSPALSLLNPELPGADPDPPITMYDPEQARALLEQSVYRRGDRLSFHDYSGVNFGEYFEAMAMAWYETLGLRFSVFTIASDSGFARALENGEVQMVYRELSASYPSQQEFIEEFVAIFGTDNSAPELETLRGMVDAARRETDNARIVELHREIDRYVSEQVLAIPLYWSKTGDGDLMRVQSWVEDFEIPIYGSGSIFKNVRLGVDAPIRTIED